MQGAILSLAGSEGDFPKKRETPAWASWTLAQVCFSGEPHCGLSIMAAVGAQQLSICNACCNF